MIDCVVILDNIRSVHNVGSLFRTCEGAGVSKLYLCGVTPTPLDRFGRIRTDIAKVALGAETLVPWEHIPKTLSCVQKLKEEGYVITAVEQNDGSKNYSETPRDPKTAFVFGEETKGLPKEVLDASEKIIEIPMAGKKESLNVSVAAGIVLFNSQ